MAEDHFTQQCDSTRLSGARCTLQQGHEGAHMQIDSNGVTGWPNGYQNWLSKEAIR